MARTDRLAAGRRSLALRTNSRAGYAVAQASSAQEGVDVLRARGDDIRLLLTDVGLSGRSGPELAAEIRDTRPGLPILFMSGFPGRKAPGVPLADEPLDFLPKPFSRNHLLRVVRIALDEAGPVSGR